MESMDVADREGGCRGWGSGEISIPPAGCQARIWEVGGAEGEVTRSGWVAGAKRTIRRCGKQEYTNEYELLHGNHVSRIRLPKSLATNTATTMDGSMGSIGSGSVGRSRRMRLGGRMGHAEEPYDSTVCGPESFNIRSRE